MIKVRLLTTLLFTMHVLASFGQIEGYTFTRKNLKGVKRVTTTTTIYNKTDSTVHRSIFFVDKHGDIVRREDYQGKTLESWEKYEYQENGLLNYEENHHAVFVYDEKTKKHRGKIDDDTYQQKVLIYRGELLTAEMYIDCYKGSKTSNYFVSYEYDSLGRITKEMDIESHDGIVIEFVSKDITKEITMDSVRDKEKESIQTTVYEYKGDSIITTQYDDENKVYGYSLVKLNTTNKPVTRTETDAQRNKITSTSMVYNREGNLTQRHIEIIDPEKLIGDIVVGDDYQLSYNEKFLPILGVTKEKGKAVRKSVIQYQ